MANHVKMTKDGQHINVHPTTVKAHEAQGWRKAGKKKP